MNLQTKACPILLSPPCLWQNLALRSGISRSCTERPNYPWIPEQTNKLASCKWSLAQWIYRALMEIITKAPNRPINCHTLIYNMILCSVYNWVHRLSLSLFLYYIQLWLIAGYNRCPLKLYPLVNTYIYDPNP